MSTYVPDVCQTRAKVLWVPKKCSKRSKRVNVLMCHPCASKRCYVPVMCQSAVWVLGVMCQGPVGLCATAVRLEKRQNALTYLCASYVPTYVPTYVPKMCFRASRSAKCVDVVMCHLCATFPGHKKPAKT